MKFTEGNLRNFLESYPDYLELSIYGRESLVRVKDPYSPFVAVFGVHPELEKVGFYKRSPDNRNVMVLPGRRDFVKILAFFWQSLVFLEPDRHAFFQFLGEFADLPVKKSATRTQPVENKPVRYEEATSADWLESFLAANAAEWERPFVNLNNPPLFENVQTAELLKEILRFVANAAQPVNIQDVLDKGSPEQIATALFAGFRYGLLFGALDRQSAEFLIGLWPNVTTAVLKTHVKTPEPVTVLETFSTPFLVEDCTALLIACAADPFRLKDSGDLYSKAIRDHAKLLKPMPKWVEEEADIDTEVRVQVAVSYLRTFGFLTAQRSPQWVLIMSDLGKHWLELGASDRWRAIVDGIWGRKQAIPGFSIPDARIGPIVTSLTVHTQSKRSPNIEEEALWITRSLKNEVFYSLPEVLNYASILKNPLQELASLDKRAMVYLNSRGINMSDQGFVRKAWASVLREFFIQRLFACGGIRLGRLPNGLAIALTPAGRYYTSQKHEWPSSDTSGGQVIVQPNFEVAFLGESPLAESEISRFAERRGSGTGTMFQITKKSIFAAAVAGQTAEEILSTLDRVCSREVPANVRREIAGWFAQSRSVKFEVATLIRCQDKETAMRVLTLAKGKSSILTDTVIEYKGSNQERAALTKKMKEGGIRVTLPESFPYS